MCGITGILSVNKIENIDVRIEKMNNSIAHRGPDADGVFIHKNKLALGHRRLSIIDVSEGANQPMQSSTGKWQIVFNGEIYNFAQIKKELDYNFETSSDTEVILASVEAKGIEWFLSRANGMFAIALFDTEKEELLLIRDRMGIKPLYYFLDNDVLIFSSEIKAILNSGLVNAEFNELAVDEYLANRYVREPFTFFKNIFQLESGSFTKFDSSLKQEKIKYWQLPKEFNTQTEYNEEEIASQFDEELTRAIDYRRIADVPLGTYLSGGVDSSMITAVTALHSTEAVNTYTIGFPELNEFEYSQVIADKYKTHHHPILMKKEDYIKNWERLIDFKDAPLAVPNEIPLAVMSSKLKEKITVVLSGEGADELMGGYGRIFRSPFDYSNSDSSKSFYSEFIDEYEYVSRSMRDEILNTPKEYRSYFDEIIKSDFDKTSNEENVFRFFHNYHVKGLLQRVDMTTMQTSVEARVPFLDHELIEFVYKNIPYDLKLKWKDKEAKQKAKSLNASEYSEDLDTPKYLLRKIAYKYLPSEIVNRKKVGFPVPLTEWFSNLEELALELLPNSTWLKNGVYSELIAKSKNEARAGQVLWMFINIELFRKKYFDNDWRY